MTAQLKNSVEVIEPGIVSVFSQACFFKENPGQEVKQETKEDIKLEEINSEEENESSTEENQDKTEEVLEEIVDILPGSTQNSFIILSDEEHAVDKRYLVRLGNDSHVGSCEYHDFK